MNKTVIISFLAIIIFAQFSFAQTIKRQENESIEQFADRIRPDSSTLIEHQIFETKNFDPKNAILAFYQKTITETYQTGTYTDHDQYNIILGYLYLPSTENNYRRILIDTIPPDGGDPEILSVFYVNADKDTDKELAVLCKYEQRHYDYGGAFYETFIYDFDKKSNRFTYLEKLSDKLFGCECGFRDGRNETAKYKTAKDVREGLRKMGY
ncbi:hypothetical protein A8C56_21010 [Niabella ginsenosidivorans]|uniref:Uncharacterized protein n=1 Tax=Niabella ginsenosidivorans TaxID=1176587 RepID=A0A1A9I7V9_9BACT|nr:hypothetical protein [Niabella ginsenosidivorans]ANH83129.1 hypothetical protein A8C56_21010 [Niabella ginsenosidivorans]